MAARPKTVVDLLSEQSEEELLTMQEANRRETARAQEELSRLRLEGQQIEQALARRARGGSGRVTITNEQVYQAAVQIAEPMTAADVQQRLAASGFNVKINTIRNHLNRLVEAGKLKRRDEDGKYVVPQVVLKEAPDFGAADDDIPF